jgi:pimeloyl-ACP methyl ester carboxylesterase
VRTGRFPAVVAVTLTANACSSSTPGGAARVPQPGELRVVSSPSSGDWARYRIDRPGGGIDVYIARDATPKPVVLLIQGSGCIPLVTVNADGTIHDTTLFQDLIGPRLERLHFALVEKRGIEPLRFSEGMSRSDKQKAFDRAERECGAEYLQNATKQARVEDVAATIGVLASQPWARQIILAGHSEGTHVATGVLRIMKEPRIAAAGLFASAGPTPFFGRYVARGAGDRAEFRQVFEEVRMLQRADDDFLHDGLPGRRWKTFWLQSTPIEDVRESVVPIFVAQGTRDGTTLPADLFALEAIRQQPNRPLRYVIVLQGDHAFETPDGKPHVQELFDDFVQWALDTNRQTGLRTIGQ